MEERLSPSLENDSFVEKEGYYNEITIINPPLFPHEGRINIGQLVSVTLADITYRYYQDKSMNLNYASASYNVQGKPVERNPQQSSSINDFVEEARNSTKTLTDQIENEKLRLGVAESGLEFIDSDERSQAVVQQRFLELYKKGFVYREGHNFFLDSKRISQKYDLEEAIESIAFYPSSLKSVMKQLINDALTPIQMSKDRLFSTPIPLYICDHCGNDSIPENTDFPIDPRVEECDCADCGSKMKNNSGDTIAPLFDLTQQNNLLSPDHSGITIQVCGRNVMTKYVFFSLLTNIALDGKVPFDVLLTHGYLNDSTGERMAKWNGNMIYVDELLKDYHPDAVRFAVLRAMSFNENSSNFDERDIAYGQKFVHKVGNLRKFFKMNKIDLSVIEPDVEFLDRHNRLMLGFNFKLAFELAEQYLSQISQDIHTEREVGSIDIIDKASRYKSVLIVLQPFLPTIVNKALDTLVNSSLSNQ